MFVIFVVLKAFSDAFFLFVPHIHSLNSRDSFLQVFQFLFKDLPTERRVFVIVKMKST